MDLVAVGVVAVIVVLVGVVGIRVGMLLAPRIERWGAPRDDEDEDQGADHGG